MSSRGERTLVRVLAQRVDVRGLDDAGAALDDARGLAEVARGVFVAGEGGARARAERLVRRVVDLAAIRRWTWYESRVTHEVGFQWVRVRGGNGGVRNAGVHVDTLVAADRHVSIVERHVLGSLMCR